MQRALSLAQSPPLGAVLRLFLSTPLFALLAGALLLWQGAPALQSRWTPATVALTHLFTLGALGMAMAGALIQLLPVVAGAALPRTRTLAPVVHALLGAGTLALAAGFVLGAPWLLRVALALLLPALLWLAAALAVALWQPHPPGAAPMVATMRVALAALLIALTLAAPLAAVFAGPASVPRLPLPVPLLTDLHALWGVLGWGALLVIGVAFQVVPMFQVTPVYHPALARWLGVVLFVLLVLASIAALLLRARVYPLHWPARAWVMGAYAVFAVATLRLLARRKRPEPDAMTLFWRLAMVSLLACAALAILPAGFGGAAYPLTLGVLAIVGFLYSAVNGMLYKIVPFLVWHHMQEAAPAGYRVPGIKLIIPDTRAQRQFWLHCAALLMLLAACWWPVALARPAAVALCASSGFLLLNLMSAVRICVRQRSLLDAASTP